MTWMAWRQFRVPVLSVFVGLAVIGVVLVISRLDLAGETNFSDQQTPSTATQVLLTALPAILGVFWGVPMITRELENGTLSLAWNQTVTRTRWLTDKMVIGVAAAMVAAGLLSLVVSWWASPIDALAGVEPDSVFDARMSPLVFVARGIVPIGYAAFAFVLGVAVGIVLRRTVAAMAVTLVVFLAVQVLVPLVVRPHLLPPVVATVPITAESIQGVHAQDSDGHTVAESIVVTHPAGSWVLVDETIGPDGTVASPLPSAVDGCLGPPVGARSPLPDIRNLNACFAQLGDLGYHQRLTYQPDSRFWPLQWIETGLFLALSALLTWFCFRRVRYLS
jgi:hypothetical protein